VCDADYILITYKIISEIEWLLTITFNLDIIKMFNQTNQSKDRWLLGCDNRLMYNKTFEDYRLT